MRQQATTRRALGGQLALLSANPLRYENKQTARKKRLVRAVGRA
jgi:hypothetical protein